MTERRGRLPTHVSMGRPFAAAMVTCSLGFGSVAACGIASTAFGAGLVFLVFDAWTFPFFGGLFALAVFLAAFFFGGIKLVLYKFASCAGLVFRQLALSYKNHFIFDLVGV